MQSRYALTLFAFVLVVVSPAIAHASEPSSSKTWIFIIAPGCSFEDSDDLRTRLNYNNTGYEAFLPNRFEAVCMSGVDVLTVEKVTVPLLRSVFPSDVFLFAYGDVQTRDYKLYAVSKYAVVEYALAPLGNADVERGYGLAQLSQHGAIQHERAHLENCSAHLKGSDGNDVSSWNRTASRPWCM